MKKILTIILVLTVLTSCSDFLNEQPVSSLSAETFWKTPEDAQVGITGLYDALQGALRDNFFDWGEARSDNFTAGGTGQFQVDLAVGNLSSTMGAANWSSLYSVIGIANQAIKYLPAIKDLDAKTTNNYLAQAYTMRAYCYFYLVRIWGDAVVWTEPFEDLNAEAMIPRTSAAEVLNNLILPDLQTAYSLVDKAISGPAWFINVGPILAIQTDVHMWMHNYQLALNTSQALMDLKRYSLENSALSNAAQKRAAIITGWKNIFTNPTATKEAIWSLNWNFLQDGRNGIGSRTGSSGQTSQFEIDDPLQNIFEATTTSKRDIRRGQTYDTLKVTSNVDQIWKYYVAVNGVIQYQNVNQCEAKLSLYRYAEVLLWRAEAYNELNDRPTALGLLNQVRTRAQLPAILITAVPDKATMAVAILNERQLEFVAEGKRWFDLVRTGKAAEIMNPVLQVRQKLRGLAQTGFNGQVLFPIHQDVLNQNKSLSQNKGYN